MTVYVVLFNEWEDRTIVGVLSTKEAADELCATLQAMVVNGPGHGQDGYYVDEFVVDGEPRWR